jgi:RHS repeat-associated protein
MLAESLYSNDMVSSPVNYAFTLPSTRKAQNKSCTYNFMGQPLMQTMTYYDLSNNAWTLENTVVNQYAYWGASKYFQQMATLDNGGRMTFTDYYDCNAAVGSKGQTHYVYDPKNGTVSVYPSTSQYYTTPPSNASASEAWRWNVYVATPADYSAMFQYDSVGRPTDVYKLQSTSTSPWTYVHTTTAYGSNTDGSWGAASVVTEDSGGINRITQTLAYDTCGRATEVEDASGKIFETAYDKDGVIQSVSRIDNGLNQPIAVYTYGPAGTTSYGQPVTIQDGLSGVTQSISYYGSGIGGASGLPESVTETNGSDSYTVSYTYNTAGDRATASYTTPAGGTVNWGYSNYVSVGLPPNMSRVFCTLTKLDSNMNATSEEFDYQYDGNGRLAQAAFAQTPQSGQTGYSSSHPAASRCRAAYQYDAQGQLLTLNHWWDVLGSGGTYTSYAVLGNTCTYDPTLGLKTSSSFWVQNTSTPTAFTLSRTETYGYDQYLDYLTSANYNDGLNNSSPTWSYDAAGNRTDSGSTFDNLNRATAIQGTACTDDILGNRLTLGSELNGGMAYTWDALNRMASCQQGTLAASSYQYRADGMRVWKQAVGSITRYRYDGQIGIEDATGIGVTQYGIGARGIDYIYSASTMNGTWTGFPVYDAHGNMVATIARSGSNGYAVANQQSFDAWGNTRIGSGSGCSQGYCANLGHRQDAESSLIYMRARYYEPASGRFISQDPGRHGLNWFSYCGNDPVSRADKSGKDWYAAEMLAAVVLYFAAEAVLTFAPPTVTWLACSAGLLAGAIGFLAAAFADIPGPSDDMKHWVGFDAGLLGCVLTLAFTQGVINKAPFLRALSIGLGFYDAALIALLWDINLTQ